MLLVVVWSARVRLSRALAGVCGGVAGCIDGSDLYICSSSFSPFSTMRRGSRIFGKEEPTVQVAQPGATPASSESSTDDDDLSVLSRRLMNRSNRESTDEDDEYDANAA